MADTSILLNRIGKQNPFTRNDLQTVMEECGYQTSESIVNHTIIKMLAAGDIVKIGRNKYCISDSLNNYHFQHSELAISVAEEIIEDHPYVDFRIFELFQLNEFVTRQVPRNIVFVSVEGNLQEDVFDILWEKHKGSILLKPDAGQLFRYMNDDMVVILKLPSESPKGVDVFWNTRIEKMLVDIAVDKLLKKVVCANEFPAIYQDAFRKYAVDMNTMFRYASRRGALKKYLVFLANEAGLKQENFA